MDYSLDIEDLDRPSLLFKLQLQNSKQGTATLRRILLNKMKKCHPIHTELKQIALVDLKRITNEIGLNVKCLEKQNSGRLRHYLANYYFDKNPTAPLTTLQHTCSKVMNLNKDLNLDEDFNLDQGTKLNDSTNLTNNTNPDDVKNFKKTAGYLYKNVAHP